MSAARATWLVLAAACAALPVRAQDAVAVISPRADSIAVTIYRDDLALITETRTVTLPESPVTLVLDGVVDTLLPQSAVLADVARPLAESNFAFDQLTPKSLLARSIGETVTVTRTNPKTGVVTRTAATVISAGEGVVLALAGGNEALYCSGLPERLELARVPDALLAKPQLSVKLAAGEAGPRTVKVSYLAHGFAWSSDYVAQLNERSDRMSLKGWATLTNSTGTAFEQAEVQVVAGALNIIDAADGGSRADPFAGAAAERAAADVALLRECFAKPLPPKMFRRAPEQLRFEMAAQSRDAMLEGVTVSASRVAQREELGDYQLYRIPWPTDLGARQTKQVLFLDKPAVHVERFYGYRFRALLDSPPQEIVAPDLVLRWENTERAGLGEPLPRGIVRVFEPYGEASVFGGEAEVEDKPVGLPVELTIGRAQNVALDVGFEIEREGGPGSSERSVVTAAHRIVNNKSVPVDVEIRHAVESGYSDARVADSSKQMRKKYGDFAWRFVVQPGSEETLSYDLSALGAAPPAIFLPPGGIARPR